MRLSQFAIRQRRRLSGRLLSGDAAWGYFMCCLAAGVIALGSLSWDAYRSAESQAAAKAIGLAVTVEQDIRRNLELLDLTAQTTIGRLELPAIQDPATQARNRALIDNVPHDQYIGIVQALDEHGNVIAGYPAPSQNKNWADRDYFRALQSANSANLYIGRPFSTSYGDNAAIPLARRITGPDGNFAGVLVVGMRLSYFRELFARLGLGPSDTASVLREDGTLLMRFPYDRNLLGDTLEASAPFYAFMRSGLMPIVSPDTVDHVERQFVFRRVGALPLVVSVGVARDEARAAAWSQLLPLLLAFAVFVATLALFAASFSRERHQREAAERESLEKSRFLTTLSHELRTPLHGVIGYADQLSRDPSLSTGQSRQVEEIMRAGRHMRDVVNGVLDYARIEALGPVLRMQRINVRKLAEDCLAMVRPGALARGLQAHVTMAAGTPENFVTDDVQLRQVLTNLLSNAVKYTVAGAVELHLMGDQERLTIEVSDTGIGIPEGQRHNLFKEYERFGTERSSVQGTGLGLAIAQRLVRRMGGYMGHRDNPGGGSVFWLELPAGAADASEPQAIADVVAPERLSVLVVDDSEVNRSVAVAYLRKAGHATIEAHDGAEAVKLAAAQDFDVVLMDMRMAGMDGLEATRRVRALPGTRGQVPIVAVTANALDQHAEECRRVGMSDYLAKPFAQTELLAVVARAAAQRPQPAIDVESLAQLTSHLYQRSLIRTCGPSL